METDLFNRFKDHPNFEYLPDPSSFNIERLELELGYELPNEYKNIIENCYSCSIKGEQDNISFWSLGDGYNLMSDVFYAIHLRGFYMIGADEEGNHYVYDANNKLGRGAYAVYYIGRADLSLKEAVFVGDNLAGAIEDLLKSTESYFDRKNMTEEGYKIEENPMPRLAVVNSKEDLFNAVPQEIHHRVYKKGVLEIESDESGNILCGYIVFHEDMEVLYYICCESYQEAYNHLSLCLTMDDTWNS
jgi:hypothetical protein